MRYKPMRKNGDVSPDVALIQAMHTLDAASEVAERINDVEALLHVSAMWVKVGEALEAYVTGHKIEGIDDMFKNPEFKTGFQKTETTEEDDA